MHGTLHSSIEQEENMSSLVLKAASLLLFFVVGIYGNGRIIYTVLVDNVLCPVLNLIVASLSIADLATCIFIMPFTFISLIYGKWVFGQVFCEISSLLVVYLATVAGFSTAAIVYERYRAIYRKRFPSLSQRQVTILLCIVWLLSVVLVAPIIPQNYSFMRIAGICLPILEQHNMWNNVHLLRKILSTSVGFLFVLFLIWKILTYLLPLRRRVSPGLLSNEEKLTVAAHLRSVWTTIIFVLIYITLVLPIHVARLVNLKRKRAGKDEIADDVLCFLLWLYWLQCAIKPLVYVVRSERFTCRLCHCLPGIRNGSTSRVFGRRKMARVYQVREIDSSNETAGRFTSQPPGEFLELRRIPINQPTDPPTLQNVSQDIRHCPAPTDGTGDDSVVIIEDLEIESYIDDREEGLNC